MWKLALKLRRIARELRYFAPEYRKEARKGGWYTGDYEYASSMIAIADADEQLAADLDAAVRRWFERVHPESERQAIKAERREYAAVRQEAEAMTQNFGDILRQAL